MTDQTENNVFTMLDARLGFCAFEQVGEPKSPPPDPELLAATYASAINEYASHAEKGGVSCSYHDDGLRFLDKFVCSPIFVWSREKLTYGWWYTRVAVKQPDGVWHLVWVPTATLNDSGSKVREILLRQGANVSVDLFLRRRLLDFLLNAAALGGK